MSTLPLPEAILLEIHQSFCNIPYPTTKKNKFSTGQISLELQKEMGIEILRGIFESLNMEPREQADALKNLEEFANAYKTIELRTWTFSADHRQILWTLLGHFFMPSLARRVAFWDLAQVMGEGMPSGRFCYLPELVERNGKSLLYMPVAQVFDWLLDLLGLPLEKFADQHCELSSEEQDLRRSMYNWRNDTTITKKSIDDHFSKGNLGDFKGAFSLDHTRSASQQFADALEFVKRKKLTPDKLRLEIPMTQEGLLEEILNGNPNENEQAAFVECLAVRYAIPENHIICQRLLLARAVQDGYVRLLKALCPGVVRDCADPQQNKVLQLFAIYKLVYNLTVDAWLKCGDQGEAAENKWFEEHLPEWDKCGLFLAILPSHRATANFELADLLSRLFFAMQPGEELENIVGFDAESELQIIERNLKRAVSFADEIRSERQLIKSLNNSIHWRTVQNETSYWVISQVAKSADLRKKGKAVSIKRLGELAASPAQIVEAISIELDSYLSGDRQRQSNDVRTKVQALLEEAESSAGYEQWEAVILQLKAKHFLACNDFEAAGKLFREALEASFDRNFGPLRGEIAKNCFAIAVANQKLNAHNHQKYYREIIAGGNMGSGGKTPSIEDTARCVSEYFWGSLYKPYQGIPVEECRSNQIITKLITDLTPLWMSGDQIGLQNWIKNNRKLLNSSMPDVDGNSILMSLLKSHSDFAKRLSLMWQMTPTDLQEEMQKFEVMLGHWRFFLGQLAKESPKQLNMRDWKGQTPLMLIADDGDTEIMKVMLQAGADPNLQDYEGKFALIGAIKSGVHDCINMLLNHSCKLDIQTSDGRTPLHTACWVGVIQTVKRLLEIQPELIRERDNYGKTPLELVEFYLENPKEHNEFVKHLARSGRRVASRLELSEIAELLEQHI